MPGEKTKLQESDELVEIQKIKKDKEAEAKKIKA